MHCKPQKLAYSCPHSNCKIITNKYLDFFPSWFLPLWGCNFKGYIKFVKKHVNEICTGGDFSWYFARSDVICYFSPSYVSKIFQGSFFVANNFEWHRKRTLFVREIYEFDSNKICIVCRKSKSIHLIKVTSSKIYHT